MSNCIINNVNFRQILYLSTKCLEIKKFNVCNKKFLVIILFELKFIKFNYVSNVIYFREKNFFLFIKFFHFFR